MEEEKKEIQIRLVENKTETKKEEITDILKLISPGTLLRTAIEGVQKAKTGGLIVADNDIVQNIVEGGFKINCRFTPQKIIELGKMDGAIILSKDLKKILHANVLLTPNNSIPSNETGTRHKAAERTAKQANTMVIAVSQRRDEITLFYKNIKYVIRNASDIIRRANEILQILEKHKEVFEKNKKELDREELEKKPKLLKALLLIQRGVMILKISETLKGYLIELGTEGTILKSRLKELLYRLEKEIDNVIKDYSRFGLSKSKKILSVLSYDELLDVENIEQCLGISEEVVHPKGHRFLEMIGIPEEDGGILVKNFKNLSSILELKREDLIPFFEEGKILEILEKINHIKE
ncbi:DNA integrity scanning diadenylate cyclase DisA [Candidatus Pacearchaeota archaeon]|nr:DNA integrity scanning diadenylate cyclase DisA [Candidatus Pacearchaeota archaeon]